MYACTRVHCPDCICACSVLFVFLCYLCRWCFLDPGWWEFFFPLSLQGPPSPCVYTCPILLCVSVDPQLACGMHCLPCRPSHCHNLHWVTRTVQYSRGLCVPCQSTRVCIYTAGTLVWRSVCADEFSDPRGSLLWRSRMCVDRDQATILELCCSVKLHCLCIALAGPSGPVKCVRVCLCVAV